MTNVSFNDLEDAVLMVSNDSSFTAAWVCRDTGKVYIRSDMLDDEREPLPADIDESERFISVPDARSLDLEQALVFGFVQAHLAGEEDQVRQFFRRPGAYRRFGKLVDDRGLRDQWHRFRDERTRAALGSWCEENGLRLAS